MELTVVVHHERESFWSEISEFRDASRQAER